LDQIRIGVIGCGYWGPNLIRNLVDLPSSQVVAAADLREERLADISRRFPHTMVTTDFHELFDMNLDAVVVATSAATHFPIARECLLNNLSIFVEKPFTLDSNEAEELITLAHERDLMIMVGHTFEYNPAVQMLKEIIVSGELGTIYYVDAIRTNLGPVRRDYSALWDLAAHDISILLYILGSDPLAVYAQGGDYISSGGHDLAYLHLTFPD
jgi:predicted dehydrogenase